MKCIGDDDGIIGRDSLKIRRWIFDGVLDRGNVLGASDVILFGAELNVRRPDNKSNFQNESA